MGKGIAINKPLSGLGWRMNIYMNVCLGTASLYYFLLFTYYLLLEEHTYYLNNLLNPCFAHFS